MREGTRTQRPPSQQDGDEQDTGSLGLKVRSKR